MRAACVPWKCVSGRGDYVRYIKVTRRRAHFLRSRKRVELDEELAKGVCQWLWQWQWEIGMEFRVFWLARSLGFRLSCCRILLIKDSSLGAQRAHTFVIINQLSSWRLTKPKQCEQICRAWALNRVYVLSFYLCYNFTIVMWVTWMNRWVCQLLFPNK